MNKEFENNEKVAKLVAALQNYYKYGKQREKGEEGRDRPKQNAAAIGLAEKDVGKYGQSRNTRRDIPGGVEYVEGTSTGNGSETSGIGSGSLSTPRGAVGDINDYAISQGFGSAGTSLRQVASGLRKVYWKAGTTNLDLGGGRFDEGTDYLASEGVANLIFDPYNRTAEHNKAVAERVREDGEAGGDIEELKDEVLKYFHSAIKGNENDRGKVIGSLTSEGRVFLEKVSGLKLKEDVDFVLNPSNMVHIYKDHYGENEKDKGNNVPLTDEDLRNMYEIISHPDSVLFGIEEKTGRKMFFFFKKNEKGTYNLAEVYSDKHGNLTASSLYNTKKEASQRVMEIKRSLLPTSVTYSGATPSSTAKIPTLFDIAKGNSVKFNQQKKNESEEDELYRDGDEVEDILSDGSMGFDERITAAAVKLSADNADDRALRDEAMRQIGGNLSQLRRAMSQQRLFDAQTVKRVSDLAKILLEGGYLNSLSRYEVKRLLAPVKNSVGRNDIREDGEVGGDIEDVNRRFNEELQKQIDGTLPKNHVYKLGKPSGALLYAGVEDLPIEMLANTLETKSSKDYVSEHPFRLEDVKNLPQAINAPIAIFDSETKDGRKVILTELKDEKGNNFVAVLDVVNVGGRNHISINDIISLYPKDSNIRIAKWFDSEFAKLTKKGEEPLLKWADTKKASEWLANHTSDVHVVGLSSGRIAKLIQKFESVQTFDENNSDNPSVSEKFREDRRRRLWAHHKP